MLRKKFLGIFIIVLAGLTGCSVKFDPSSISSTDRIGVLGTKQKTIVKSGGLGSQIYDLATNGNALVYAELNALELHNVVSENFAKIAPDALATSFVRSIHASNISRDSNNKIDLLSTAKSLHFDKIINLHSWIFVSTRRNQNSPYGFWLPKLQISAKMIRMSDEEVLWDKTVDVEGPLIAKRHDVLSFDRIIFREPYKLLVNKAVNHLIQDLYGK